MNVGEKLLIVCAARKRKPQYREAFLEEFTVPPHVGTDAQVCALWVEVLLNGLAQEWGKRGRAHW